MKKKGLIIDANLFLLLVIGSVEEGRHIRNSSRLNKFGIEDFDTVRKVMRDYKKIFYTPYIATEVSNLIDLHGDACDKAYGFAKVFFQLFEQLDVSTSQDCESDLFLIYGLTDASLINLASDYVVFTDDNRLLPALYRANYKNIIPYESVRGV